MSESVEARRGGLLSALAGAGRVLVVVAAPKEAEALANVWGVPAPGGEWSAAELGPHADLVRSGVGPANAAGCAAACFDTARHTGLVSAGIAGALPGGSSAMAAAIGEAIAGSAAVFADAGLRTPEGFVTQAAMGFPHLPGVTSGVLVPDAEWLRIAESSIARAGPIATVSAASGTDGSAQAVASRTGALVEAMEGAGVLLVAARLGCPAIEVRTVSNTTGDRGGQSWDLARGLAVLGSVLGPAR